MKKLASILLAVLLLGTGYPVEGSKKVSYSRAFYMRDDMPFTVRLPGGEKQGLVDISTGRWIIPPRYEQIKQLSNMTAMGNDYLDDVLAVKMDGHGGSLIRRATSWSRRSIPRFVTKGKVCCWWWRAAPNMREA
jgi:hypothetical protein